MQRLESQGKFYTNQTNSKSSPSAPGSDNVSGDLTSVPTSLDQISNRKIIKSQKTFLIIFLGSYGSVEKDVFLASLTNHTESILNELTW